MYKKQFMGNILRSLTTEYLPRFSASDLELITPLLMPQVFWKMQRSHKKYLESTLMLFSCSNGD